MKKLFLILMAVVAMTSCKSYVQFYDVQSNIQTDDSFYYIENDDCKITFNFWGDFGTAGVTFMNKTDQNLYIALDQSSFVFNGYSNPMYSDTSVQTVLSKINVVSTHQAPVVCVAPHAFSRIYDKSIVDRMYTFCEDKKDFPRRSYSETFSEEDSPIKFNYFINYSFDKGCKNVNLMSADFYVNKIENKTDKQAKTQTSAKDCINFRSVHVLMIDGQSPMRFYIDRKPDL